jgi:hypothetical protein
MDKITGAKIFYSDQSDKRGLKRQASGSGRSLLFFTLTLLAIGQVNKNR